LSSFRVYNRFDFVHILIRLVGIWLLGVRKALGHIPIRPFPRTWHFRWEQRRVFRCQSLIEGIG
jgi:hypothetical protein